MDRLILLIGIAVILGSTGGRIFARLRVPQVVGYIIIGILAILVGGAWFHDITPEDIKRLEPISLFALAIIGFSVGGELKADLLSGGAAFSLMNALGKPLYHILGSIIWGALVGSAYVVFLRLFYNREMILPLCIGGLLSIIGICHYLDLDLILAAMSNGVMAVNLAPLRSREAFDQLARFAPPIFVLFFVLVGAHLQLEAMAAWMIVVAVVYVFGRTTGKFMEAYFGSKWGGLPATVWKYLGFCLFSQAGVAIGLAIFATHRFPYYHIRSAV